jgi:hypothetical protein
MTSPFRKRKALAVLALLAPLAAWSQVSVSVTFAPPPLPLYAQPPIPGDGYLWTPGYWAWDPANGDYLWVPGTWVMPPSAGLLWTPGYWAFSNGGYGWHRGYWGSQVGYYGGLHYGYGYDGSGYGGGRWERGHFRYNSNANNIPPGRVHDVYRAPVSQRPAPTESFNGGNSHLRTPPTANERRFEGRPHGGPTPEQVDHEHRAIGMPEQRLGNNHGMPPTAATPRPGGFGDPQVEHGRPAPQPHAQPEMRAQPVRPGPGPGPGRDARPQGEPGGHPGGGRPEGEHR